jgi:hypothetical protein
MHFFDAGTQKQIHDLERQLRDTPSARHRSAWEEQQARDLDRRVKGALSLFMSRLRRAGALLQPDPGLLLPVWQSAEDDQRDLPAERTQPTYPGPLPADSHPPAPHAAPLSNRCPRESRLALWRRRLRRSAIGE